jgi:hypothetical protein
MRLDFVGVDPDNPNDQCPAVFVDPDTGDFYMQGETVTDPAVPELTDHLGQFDDISDVQRGARNLPYIMDRDVGSCLRKSGHRRQKLLPAQRRDHTGAPAWFPCHRDRPAQGEHIDPAGRRARDSHNVHPFAGYGQAAGTASQPNASRLLASRQSSRRTGARMAADLDAPAVIKEASSA